MNLMKLEFIETRLVFNVLLKELIITFKGLLSHRRQIIISQFSKTLIEFLLMQMLTDAFLSMVVCVVV